MRSLSICDISYSILISWLSENQREETIVNQTNKQKPKQEQQQNPFDLQCLLPERYDTMMVTQSLWEQLTHNWFDLKSTSKDETHTLHSWLIKNQRLDSPET